MHSSNAHLLFDLMVIFADFILTILPQFLVNNKIGIVQNVFIFLAVSFFGIYKINNLKI